MTNKKHTHKTINEGVSCEECISHAVERSIEDQHELVDKHTPDIVKEMVDEFANEFVNYIKIIKIGQYNESGVNIGFKTAYNLMRERLQESLTKAYQQGYKDGEKGHCCCLVEDGRVIEGCKLHAEIIKDGEKKMKIDKYSTISKMMNKLLGSNITQISKNIFHYRDLADDKLEALKDK